MISPGISQKKFISGFLVMLLAGDVYSLAWRDLWISPDKQAETLMNKGEFATAATLFQQEPWKATAAYRAKNYKQAAHQFGALGSESGYYNQGNALAQMGNYQEALKAYDKALALNPSNQDAVFNRKLVEELLKKNQDEQQNKENKPDDRQSENNKQQDKPSDSGDQDKKNQQDKGNSNDQQKQNDKQEQKDRDEKSEKDGNKKQDNDSKSGENAEAPPKNPKQGKNKDEKDGQVSALPSPEEREKQQAKEQWLQLIPDDPGGLMREKFLRDYLRKQRGWDQ